MSSSAVARSSRTPALDSTVTRLLVAIKQLLEALQSWSTGASTDLEVSNVYVQLGNEFNNAVAAFNTYHIDMSDLENVPQSLREILEEALANDASPAVLEIYLPQVRAIITTLLTGLKGKQEAFKQYEATRRERKSRGESVHSSSSRRHERESTSSSKSSRPRPSGSRSQSNSMRVSSGPQSEAEGPMTTPRPRRQESSQSYASDEMTPQGQRYSSRGQSMSGRSTPRTQPVPIPEDAPFNVTELNGHGSFTAPPPPPPPVPSINTPPTAKRTTLVDEVKSADAPSDGERPGSPLHRHSRASSLVPSRSLPSNRVSTGEAPPMRRGSSQAQVPTASTRASHLSSHSSSAATEDEPPKSPPLPTSPSVVPSSVKRYSLSDGPVPQLPKLQLDPVSPKDAIEEAPEAEAASQENSSTSLGGPMSSANGGISPAGDSAPIDETSLADLEQSGQLGRKASKRYSTYTLNKLTGSVSERPNRKSMLAPSSLLTRGDLDAVAEEDDDSSSQQTLTSSTSQRHKRGMREKAYGDLVGGTRTKRSSSQTSLPPLPPALVTSISGRDLVPAPPVVTPSFTDPELPPPPPPSDQKPVTPKIGSKLMEPSLSAKSALQPTHEKMNIFLQVGRAVKKADVDLDGLSLTALRVLFVNKFAYNPGSSNFPSIYIRDPSSGVQYELEDVDEVQEKCLLSLNIEPLDQIKEQIDMQMGSLAQEIRELKSAVMTSRRQSLIISQPAPDPEPVERPTDKHLRNVAKRLTRVMTRSEASLSFARQDSQTSMRTVTNGNHLNELATSPPQPSPLVPQMTGTSLVSDERASRMVTDLKTQFDEVQNLRRDLGAMRQMYSESVTSMKDTLAQVRTQAQKIREAGAAKVGGARAYIDAGKGKLDSRTQDIITKVDELGDTVESLRDDVLKKRITPKPAMLRSVKVDIEAAGKELDSLAEMIDTVRPMWKQTWEEELQNIVEEQQFLTHQEELVKDLLEDRQQLATVFGRLEDVAARGGGGRVRKQPTFLPPPPEEGHDGLSTVMLQIRGAQVDSESRLKAIEANQKIRDRERERAGRSSEFQDELKGFVTDKKLKMTGGAEETERVRQIRNEQVMKAMFATTPLSF